MNLFNFVVLLKQRPSKKSDCSVAAPHILFDFIGNDTKNGIKKVYARFYDDVSMIGAFVFVLSHYNLSFEKTVLVIFV